jgi:site-specific DNA-methyltransferase (adenine-specific)
MILIFAAKISRSVFNPQNTACEFRPRGIQLKRTASRRSTLYGRESRETTWIDDGRRHPTSVLDFACCRGADRIRIHPTQKPLDLLRWLVRTYSNPGDLIVDPFAGGGTTAVAALVEGRRFWGCEKDRKFHAAATRRIRESAAPARAAA